MIVGTKISKFQRNAPSAKAICGLNARLSMEIESLSVFAVFVTVLWGMGMRMLYSHIEHSVALINMKEPSLTLTEELKQEFYDLLNMALEDTVGNMKMPSAFDHALGAISQIVQSRMMAKIPPQVFEGVTALADHGSPQEEENY